MFMSGYVIGCWHRSDNRSSRYRQIVILRKTNGEVVKPNYDSARFFLFQKQVRNDKKPGIK
jgi:hypothetical protein